MRINISQAQVRQNASEPSLPFVIVRRRVPHRQHGSSPGGAASSLSAVALRFARKRLTDSRTTVRRRTRSLYGTTRVRY